MNTSELADRIAERSSWLEKRSGMQKTADSYDLLGLTARLVAAYLRGNPMEISELSDLLHATYAALAATGAPESRWGSQRRPVVSVKKSITLDAIICLECGSHKQMLKRHLYTAHDLSVEDYKAKWRLSPTYPMTAPAYASIRSKLAKKIGLGRKRAKL